MTMLPRALYVVRYLPVWALRRLTGTGRYGPRAHRAESSWDL